jgi:hypothetical protein
LNFQKMFKIEISKKIKIEKIQKLWTIFQNLEPIFKKHEKKLKWKIRKIMNHDSKFMN